MSVSPNDVQEGRLNDGLETQLESISAQVEAGLEEGRNRLADWKATAGDRTRQAFSAVNHLARDKPWQLILGATAVGLILGCLLSPRRH